MAPKGALTQAQKLEKILSYFHESKTCHTLKDLETAIPAATKIHKMQIKDLIKELADNNQIKVEKIGSGNWYWAWAGEEFTEKQNEIMSLDYERVILETSINELQTRLETLNSARTTANQNPKFHDLMSQVESLEADVEVLCREKDSYERTIRDDFKTRQQDHQDIQNASRQLTDNIDGVEAWLLRIYQGDSMALDAVRRECYGETGMDSELFDDSD